MQLILAGIFRGVGEVREGFDEVMKNLGRAVVDEDHKWQMMSEISGCQVYRWEG